MFIEIELHNRKAVVFAAEGLLGRTWRGNKRVMLFDLGIYFLTVVIIVGKGIVNGSECKMRKRRM
jgi:hypothetical protein